MRIMLMISSLFVLAYPWAALAQSSQLPVVRLIGTGGTIAHVPAREDAPDEFVSPKNVIETISSDVNAVAEVQVEDLMRKPSQDFTIQDYLLLAQRINEIFTKETEVAGIVVTEGSNAVEETAYFLNLTVKSDKPVVVTAANRLFTSISSDSPMNLLDSIRVAAAPQARGKGVLVVTNNKINGARDVIKVDRYIDNYQARDLGVFGYVDGDQVDFYRVSTKKHTTRSEFDVSGKDSLPRVDVIYTYVAADDLLIRAAVEQGKAEGLVVASFSTGVNTPLMQETMEEVAKKGVVVVRVNRGGEGRLPMAAQRFPLAVTGNTLSPQQARILLMLALTKTKDRKEIQRLFNEH